MSTLPKSVQRVVARLEAAGFIVTVNNWGKGIDLSATDVHGRSIGLAWSTKLVGGYPARNVANCTLGGKPAMRFDYGAVNNARGQHIEARSIRQLLGSVGVPV